MTTIESSNPANLLEQLDKKLMVSLRDGRTLVGYLRSIDQFANLVLHRTVERVHVGKQYSDIDRGIYIVRGENVAWLGEVDHFKDPPKVLQKISLEEIFEIQEAEEKARSIKEKLLAEAYRKRGLLYIPPESSLELL